MVQLAFKSFLLIGLFTTLAVSSSGYLSAQTKSDASPREALLTAMKAHFGARSFVMKEAQSSAHEGVMIDTITTGNYVAPDKYHAIIESDLAGSSKRELILLGGVVYVNSGDGKWQQKQADPQGTAHEFARLRNAVLIDNLTKARNADVRLVGPEELDSSSMLIYQYLFSDASENPTRYQTRVWVGVDDGLPHKIEVQAWVTGKGVVYHSKTSRTYSDYNADKVIEAPM